MLDKKYLEKRTEFDEKVKSMKTTGMKFTTVSGEKIEPLYAPDDIENINHYSFNIFIITGLIVKLFLV